MLNRRTWMSGLAAAALCFAGEAAAGKGGSGKGGNGKGGGGRNGSGSSGHGQGKPKSPPGTAPAAAPTVPDASVRHRNGITETVRGGRYEMRDGRNRVIVNRKAKPGDYQRIRRAG